MNPKDYQLGRRCALCTRPVCDTASGMWCRRCRQSVVTNVGNEPKFRVKMDVSDFAEVNGVLVRTVTRA